MSDINKYTTKEVLNKVLLDSSGDAVAAFSHTSQEAFNAALDDANSRLNVSLVGGTIGGDVTISGDLTVNGDSASNISEVIQGDMKITSSASSHPLLIIEDTNEDDNMGALQFIKDSASPSTGDKLMTIWAYGNNNAAESTLYSEIATLPTSVADGSEEGSMRFRVMNAGSFGETMRIKGDKLGIGTASPSALVHLTSSSADGNIIVESTHASSSAVVDIRSVADRDSYVQFREGTAVKASVYNDASADALVLTDGANTTTLSLAGTNATFAGDVTVPSDIIHAGDTDNKIKFEANKVTLSNTDGTIVSTPTSGGISSLYVTAIHPSNTDVYRIGGMQAQIPNSAWLSANVKLLGPALTGYGTGIEYLKFETDGTNKFSTFSGVVNAHSGINFPDDASANPSSDANTLDNYEEGDWSPVLSDGTNNATMSSSYNTASYIKVGKVVTIQGRIVTTSLGSVSGAIRLTGLPFTVASGNRHGSIAVSEFDGGAFTAGHSVTATCITNSTNIYLKLFDVTTGTTSMQHSEWTADGAILFGGSYIAE